MQNIAESILSNIVGSFFNINKDEVEFAKELPKNKVFCNSSYLSTYPRTTTIRVWKFNLGEGFVEITDRVVSNRTIHHTEEEEFTGAPDSLQDHLEGTQFFVAHKHRQWSDEYSEYEGNSWVIYPPATFESKLEEIADMLPDSIHFKVKGGDYVFFIAEEKFLDEIEGYKKAIELAQDNNITVKKFLGITIFGNVEAAQEMIISLIQQA